MLTWKSGDSRWWRPTWVNTSFKSPGKARHTSSCRPFTRIGARLESFSTRYWDPITPEDPTVLTKIARKTLREEFLSADAGMSGANFAVADTGSLVIFTNEGNGRMVTTLPPFHIAVLSIEKVIPSLTDLPAFMRLLPRSATGQTITTYMSVITGTRKPSESTGAQELHIILWTTDALRSLRDHTGRFSNACAAVPA